MSGLTKTGQIVRILSLIVRCLFGIFPECLKVLKHVFGKEGTMPTTRPCDPEKLFNAVQAQLLRGCRPAVRRLTRAARGRSDFRSDLELKACLGMARLAADLLYGRSMRKTPVGSVGRFTNVDNLLHYLRDRGDQ